MAFLTEPTPTRGVALPAAQGIARIVAGNPGPMTYRGTNTWLVEGPDGLMVIDPGPEDGAHTSAILAQAGGPIARILLTHTHPDHVGGVAALRAATGAPVFGWHAPWLAGFAPDVALGDGEAVGGLTALHTPGHASDHLCFARRDGVVFSGDHVMSWNTSIVNPPDGDMAQYMESLRRMLAREDVLYLCGHGPPLADPRALVRAMLTHRVSRELAVLGVMENGPTEITEIVEALYGGLDTGLKRAAERSVLAHLLKLQNEGRIRSLGDMWYLA